jgi:hypothetical protein
MELHLSPGGKKKFTAARGSHPRIALFGLHFLSIQLKKHVWITFVSLLIAKSYVSIPEKSILLDNCSNLGIPLALSILSFSPIDTS